jgi:hypothetical protein
VFPLSCPRVPQVSRDVPSDACLLSDGTAGRRNLIKETPLVLMGLLLISRQKYRRRCSVCSKMTSAMICKKCGIQLSWPNRGRHYHLRIFVEKRRKNTKNISQDIRCPDRNSIWGPHEEFLYINAESIIKAEDVA